MSSPNALATVTATLQHLLSNVAPGATVTTRPPSTARNGGNGEQLNIFLYSTHYNAAFRNTPMPGAVRNGEHAYPPLPLVLKYLITAYGANDDDISGQQLMGQAMSLLHNHPLLGSADIDGITPDSNLDQQIERIRITPDTLSLDDMSKLWSSFQSAEYRLSVGYEVSVVLIESTRVSRTPLPVLKRGERDQGPEVIASLLPSLSGLRFPRQKPSAELGDLITLLGEHLTHANTIVRLQHPRLKDPINIQPQPSLNEGEMAVQLPALSEDPDLSVNWPAGFYKLFLLTEHPEEELPLLPQHSKRSWKSNSLSMPLSPRIETIDPQNALAGDVVLTVTCRPQIREGQQVLLLFGDRIITFDDESLVTPDDPVSPTTLIFNVEKAAAREIPYVLRLRVDGVDSIPVDFSKDTPQFADNQKVTIT